MKKQLLSFGILLILATTLLAQAPQSFKYQAIARDIEGNVLSDQQVSLKINLLQGDKTGQLVYSETHDLKTNQFGLINLEIGMGKNKSGEISSISWGLSKYFVNVEIDINGGSDYESMGVSQLLSVPYALYAETSGNGSKQSNSWTTGAGITWCTLSGDDVGVGTSAPSSKFEVVGKGTFENVYGSITDVSTANAHVVSNKFEVLYEPTTPSAVKGSSMQIKAVTADPAVTNFTNFLQGLRFSLIHRNNGTVAQLIGGRFQMGMPSGTWGGTGTSGTIKSMKGIDMELYGQKGTVDYGTGISLESVGGNFTNLTYLRINQATDVAGNWGIFNNSSYDNYFAGATGIGIASPATNLHVYESNTHTVPAFRIQQAGSGDASQHFMLGTATEHFSQGIDNNDNDNFKINNAAQLKGTTYGEATTMVRIHNENQKDGIIDFNHQSRARVWLQRASFIIPPGVWTRVEFDTTSYDEHGEWTFVDATGIAHSVFTALEEGYYQVNSRIEYLYDIPEYFGGAPWCSIAIFKDDGQGAVMYAQGNNLELRGIVVVPTMPPPQIMEWGEDFTNNNAPNVSDVVYLKAGEKIEIYGFHTYMGGSLSVLTGHAIAYCSVHKVS